MGRASREKRQWRQWKQRKMKESERMEAYKQKQREMMDALERGEIEWWQLDGGTEDASFGTSLSVGV